MHFRIHVGVEPKIGVFTPPKSSHFDRGFPLFSPSILGVKYPLFLGWHPCFVFRIFGDIPGSWFFLCEKNRRRKNSWKKNEPQKATNFFTYLEDPGMIYVYIIYIYLYIRGFETLGIPRVWGDISFDNTYMICAFSCQSELLGYLWQPERVVVWYPGTLGSQECPGVSLRRWAWHFVRLMFGGGSKRNKQLWGIASRSIY